MARRSARRAFSILEVSIGAFLLAFLMVPTWNMLQGAGKSIERTDQRRMTRFLANQILERVEAVDFMVLYNEFKAAKNVVSGANPLNLSQETIDEVARQGWTVSLRFEFMTHDELGTNPGDPMKAPKGILHLQGGHITLAIDRPGLPDAVFRKPLYCPLILGRPGLLVSQCPALNAALRASLAHVP